LERSDVAVENRAARAAAVAGVEGADGEKVSEKMAEAFGKLEKA